MLYPVELRAPRSNPKINGRGGEIRTPDPLLPKQLRYQAALHPDTGQLVDVTDYDLVRQSIYIDWVVKTPIKLFWVVKTR